MQQLVSVWSGLDPRKRVIVGLATIAMFAAVLLLSRIVSAPSYALLYSGLESSAAGEVVAALEQQGVAYDVRGNAIYVDSARRDELRLTLASQGLPANSNTGYELLDGMSGFGTTSQMFDAAYWRAKEGELARTIVASPFIRAARVHISNTSSQPFRREVKSTASVTVTTDTGSLSPAHAKALKFLVASAVTGLSPDDVAVIDAQGGLMQSGDEGGAGLSGSDRAAELKRNVERLLEARVGYGNAVVEVSVDTETDREQITERTFDPNGRVAISTDSTQTSTSAKDEKGNSVTVASNLPTGAAASGAGGSQSTNSETRERTNFEVSESSREVLKTPGAVRRISVAVLLDGVRTRDANGAEIWTARPEEEMLALHDLVASAVGFDAARGDIITLKSLAFEPVTAAGTLVEASFFAGLGLDMMALLQLFILGIVALALGMFVVRPILTSRPAGRLPQLGPPGAMPPPAQGARVLDGEIDDGTFDPSDLALVSHDDSDTQRGRSAVENDPVVRLRRLIAERQEETVEILRSWMEDREESV